MAPTRPEKKYYVYVLAYPDGYLSKNGTDIGGVIFYVGKGTVQKYKHLPERMDAHEIEAQQGFKSAKDNVIRDIWAKGLQVQKTKVFETDNEEEAFQYEQALIRLMNGSGKLTNIASLGGSISFVARRSTTLSRHYSDDVLPPRSPREGDNKSSRSKMAGVSATDYLNITDVARELGVNDRTVRRWITAGCQKLELNSWSIYLT